MRLALSLVNLGPLPQPPQKFLTRLTSISGGKKKFHSKATFGALAVSKRGLI
jgi:hypothetical protein